MCPAKIKEEVDSLAARGVKVKLIEAGGQWYVLAEVLPAPSPPWDRPAYDILVAIPAAYDAGPLDGFYIGLPYKFNDSTHPRVNGSVIQVEGRSWQLVSWHYPEGKPWQQGKDDLDSHLTQCRGFFLHRGAINAR